MKVIQHTTNQVGLVTAGSVVFLPHELRPFVLNFVLAAVRVIHRALPKPLRFFITEEKVVQLVTDWFTGRWPFHEPVPDQTSSPTEIL
jgi:hypothetical protein